MNDSEIKFEDYKKLVHSLAWKAQRNMHNHGVRVDYDDLYQEFAVSFVLARNAFDSTKGIKFSTYYVNAAWRNFIKFSKGSAKDAYHASLDADAYGDEDSPSKHEIIPDGSENAQERLEREHRTAYIFSQLSPNTRKAIELLENTPEILKKEFDAVCAKRRMQQANGEDVNVPRQLNLPFILSVMGLSAAQKRKVYQELSWAAGV